MLFLKKKKVILLFCNKRLLLLLFLLPMSVLGMGFESFADSAKLYSFIAFVLEKVTNSRNYPAKKTFRKIHL